MGTLPLYPLLLSWCCQYITSLCIEVATAGYSLMPYTTTTYKYYLEAGQH